MPLVEVVPDKRTAKAQVAQMVTALRGIGSEPVVLTKPVTGFIGNRRSLPFSGRPCIW